MDEMIDVLLSPKSNKEDKQKARKALFRCFMGDFAKSDEIIDAKPEAVRGKRKQ